LVKRLGDPFNVEYWICWNKKMPKRLEIHPLGARWEDADEVLAAVATLRQASGDGLGTQGSKRIGVWGGRARESIRSFSQKWFSGRDRVVERRGTDGESDAHGPRDSDDMPFQAVNRPPITKETVRESQKKDADRPGMGGHPKEPEILKVAEYQELPLSMESEKDELRITNPSDRGRSTEAFETPAGVPMTPILEVREKRSQATSSRSYEATTTHTGSITLSRQILGHPEPPDPQQEDQRPRRDLVRGKESSFKPTTAWWRRKSLIYNVSNNRKEPSHPSDATSSSSECVYSQGSGAPTITIGGVTRRKYSSSKKAEGSTISRLKQLGKLLARLRREDAR
jgi:hypothetical protein